MPNRRPLLLALLFLPYALPLPSCRLPQGKKPASHLTQGMGTPMTLQKHWETQMRLARCFTPKNRSRKRSLLLQLLM